MCLAALALMGGILIGESLYSLNVFFRFIPLAVFIAAFVAMMIVKKTRRFAFAIVMLTVGFLGICASNDVYDKNSLAVEYQGVITAKVASEVLTEDNNAWFYVEDIYVENQKLKYQGYVGFFNFDEDSIDYNAGDIVSIYGNIESIEHERFDSYYAYDVANKYGYLINAFSVYKLAEGELHPLERLPYIIKSSFYERMDWDSAAICTALVLGDKSGLDEELKDNISGSGLAHVLAVSGLHISVISAALFFVFRKFKLNSKVSVFIVSAFMLFYCFLCDFTASSLRAFIMMTVLNFTVAFGRKRDTLSTLSFAAIVILLFRPTALMEAGFLMSFAAVLGITLFYGRFNRVGMKLVDRISPKRHIGKYLSKATSLSLSANLVAFPFIAFFFKRVTVLFVLSNIIVLPYLMLIYVFLLINVVFSLIVQWTGTLVIFKYLLVPFKGYVTIFGSLSFVTIPVSITIAGIVGILVLCVFLSRFVFLKRLTKVVGATIIAAITIVISLISAYANGGLVSDSKEAHEAVSDLREEGGAPLVCDFEDCYFETQNGACSDV